MRLLLIATLNEQIEALLAMQNTQKQDEQIANMIFAKIYPLYLAKVEKKVEQPKNFKKSFYG